MFAYAYILLQHRNIVCEAAPFASRSLQLKINGWKLEAVFPTDIV